MSSRQDAVIIRPAQPGEASCACALHMKVYGSQYGFRGIFEAYVMDGMARFLLEPEGGRLWVALRGENVVGSIAIVRADAQETQLRWFVVAQELQGLGVGRRLMEEAMGFVRAEGYRRVSLWTIQMLAAARHLYQGYGFEMREEKPNTQWTGSPLIEERWEWALASAGTAGDREGIK